MYERSTSMNKYIINIKINYYTKHLPIYLLQSKYLSFQVNNETV